ncbi:hypothetical protein, partial [Brasilonema octagenarum]|uniref:hypothetical protein n=1 Tax=Brasilonema octagenarum TaxID=417105 RepID=UPI001B7D01AB
SVCVAPPSGLVATTRGTRRQIPLSGNPPAVLAPQGTTLGRTGSLRVHQSPTAGNPPAALDSPQGAALRSNFSQNSKLSRIFGNG